MRLSGSDHPALRVFVCGPLPLEKRPPPEVQSGDGRFAVYGCDDRALCYARDRCAT